MNYSTSNTRRSSSRIIGALGVALLAGFLVGTPVQASSSPVAQTVTTKSTVLHRTLKIQGINIAYREAGDPARPTVVLLHGFPTSSHMFRNLIPALSSKYHVLAPDYPGFGSSDMPALGKFDYSFANFANVVDEFLAAKSVKKYSLYIMDYGAPVGYRLFAKHPERVTGFTIQNGNAYAQGLSDFWKPLKALWAERTKANEDALRPFLELAGTRWQYTHGVKDASVVSPATWIHDQYLLDRPGNKDIQIELFHSYGTNVGEYPKWQKLFRQYQPPALLVWGKNDEIFPESGAQPYKKDLQNLEFHLLDAGHFALETHGPFIAKRMLSFLDRTTGK